MKRILILLCLFCWTACAAQADAIYKILPGEVDDAVMTAIAFGDKAGQAVFTDDGEGAVYYHLPDINGAPSFGANLITPIQLSFGVYTQEDAEPTKYSGRLSENVIASGVAPCTLTWEDALTQAEGLMEQMGLADRALLSITAYGRFTETTPFYQVRFMQTLNGRPVYWSAGSTLSWMSDVHVPSNTISVILGDEGLVSIGGTWSSFTPASDMQEVMSQDAAMQAFAAIGEKPETVELCYLMTFDGAETATATPAYRWQNRFIHGQTGELMQ